MIYDILEGQEVDKNVQKALEDVDTVQVSNNIY